MRKTYISLIMIILATSVVSGQNPQTPDERFGPKGEAWVLENTEWLEKNPLADTDKSHRTALMSWWAEAPYLTLDWCANLLIGGENEKAVSIVAMQGVFGAGAYLIKHPNEKQNEFALSLAGVESALRAYKTAVSQNESFKDPFYDTLLKKQANGDLEQHVQSKLKECKESKNK